VDVLIYLLDTDTLIFMIRGLKSSRRPTQRKQAHELVDRCQRQQAAGDSIGLSAMTISELEFGDQYSDRYEEDVVVVRKLLTPFEIYDYDSVSCPLQYGRIRHQLEAKGVTIGSMDLLIAAHALALDATLVTNNLQHFSRIVGLKMANWLSKS
jgi:tRNA(fMet)-specific endonuclease VapC